MARKSRILAFFRIAQGLITIACLSATLAASLAAALLGRLNRAIAGVSGKLVGLLKLRRGDITGRVAFIAGGIIASNIYALFFLAGLIIG